jgi:hypothetical protein
MNSTSELKLRVKRGLTLVVLALVCSSSVGCIQEMAQLLYVIKGHDVPPAFEGLSEKKVAVVCNSDARAFGPDSLSVTIAKHIGISMAASKDKISVISPKRVESFIDENGWSEDESPVKLGEAVGADYVVVIEIENYTIHEGATLFKGRSDWTASVYDMEKDGSVTFAKGPELFVFPETGRPALQTTERQFESFYLSRLCDRISKLFITHDKMASYADDAMMR